MNAVGILIFLLSLASLVATQYGLAFDGIDGLDRYQPMLAYAGALVGGSISGFVVSARRLRASRRQSSKSASGTASVEPRTGFCTHCGMETSGNDNFCGNCGAALARSSEPGDTPNVDRSDSGEERNVRRPAGRVAAAVALVVVMALVYLGPDGIEALLTGETGRDDPNRSWVPRLPSAPVSTEKGGFNRSGREGHSPVTGTLNELLGEVVTNAAEQLETSSETAPARAYTARIPYIESGRLMFISGLWVKGCEPQMRKTSFELSVERSGRVEGDLFDEEQLLYGKVAGAMTPDGGLEVSGHLDDGRAVTIEGSLSHNPDSIFLQGGGRLNVTDGNRCSGTWVTQQP